MDQPDATRQSGTSQFLCNEFALAPYRNALKFASMAHLGATAVVQLNRMLMDAYGDAVRGQQNAFCRLSAGMLSRLSHDGVSPTETLGIVSQSIADMYKFALEGAAGFEQAMASARGQYLAGIRQVGRSNAGADGGTEKQAA